MGEGSIRFTQREPDEHRPYVPYDETLILLMFAKLQAERQYDYDWEYPTVAIIPGTNIVMKDAASYTRQLTNDVHALYSKAMNRRGFISDVGGIIERELKAAWLTGADEMMVLPEDMTPEDHAFIQGIIINEKSFLEGLADAVQDAAGNKTGWESFQFRIGLWVDRIVKDVDNEARVYFGGKQKLRWNFGATEKHCNKCLALKGIVVFAEEWAKVDIRPQFHFGCDCNLSPTSERRSNNAMKRIMAAEAMTLVFQKEHDSRFAESHRSQAQSIQSCVI